MHGCNSGSALLVNAEVDSMGGVVDGGVGIGLKTSPRRAAIEKAQAVLRQEYDVREERRKELEFLEKGGNPLDFKFGNAASVSVQSTSLTDQNPEQFVTSEAKGSFALAASPHGDSVDSSVRPGIPTVCEPNTADNLLLFSGDHELPEAERSSVHPSRRNNIARSEQSSQIDGAQNAKESEDSAIVRPYARRNRSRSNREGARSNTTDVTQNRGTQGSALPVRGGSRDSKVQISEKNNQKVHNTASVSNLKTASSNGDLTPRPVTSDNQLDADLDVARVPEISTGPTKASLDEIKLEAVAPKNLNDSQNNQSSQVESQKAPDVVSGESDIGEKHQAASGFLRLPATTGTMAEEAATQLNGFSDSRENKNVPNEVEIRKAAVATKGLDSQSSCNQSNLGLDVHKDSDVCPSTGIVDSDGIYLVKTSDVDRIPDADGAGPSENVKKIETMIDTVTIKNDASYVSLSQSGNAGAENMNKDVPENSSELCTEVPIPHSNEGGQLGDHLLSETEGKVNAIANNNSGLKENSARSLPATLDVSMHEAPSTSMLDVPATVALEHQSACVNSLKVLDKAHEDSILEEARIIQAKHKRIAELSVHSLPPENRRKSHWDFVLEEMEWLANDFSQERLWKIAAAAQIGYRAAFASRSRLEQQYQRWKLKEIAHDLAKAVMQFWHSAEEPEKEQEVECPKRNAAVTVKAYAVRFLKYNSSLSLPQIAEAPATPERVSDLGIQEVSWEDHLTEESLFYTVPSGAVATYRKSIEAHVVHFEKTGSSMQEEADTSMYDAGAEYGFRENIYAEDEGETSTYYMPGAFEGNKPSKSTHKKRKHIGSSYPRSYEAGADMPYGLANSMSQQSTLVVKRPASLNVGAIPTKRMRTASRPRVVTPTANVQVQMKTDASSGDTSSYQDDQSTMHGGSQFQKSMEVDSVGDFDKQLAYDCAETSIKPKKKKKAKHMVSAYDQGWQMDSNALNEQREHSKKRLESHHFDSNGNSGLYMQSTAKKPKILKHSLENTFDNISGSIPSPVASQNNMSQTFKFIKLIGGRDRGRKSKSLKIYAGQPGSGNPWTLFEDQALVVLVHDMGQNWELISDAINSTLQFKCIFRKPKECKERHKFLMDKSNGDGADSAEDSGSSQPYPSTLPGIPKGSARQLFQRLQEPLEEDTIKSHFEKIIKIGQRQHYRRTQMENQDTKQLAPVHNSHVMALSQVFPNNLNGVLLTPLDFCDATPSNPEGLPYGCQGGSHSSALPVPNQGAAAPLLPSPGGSASLQGSSGALHGTNLPSPSGALNPSVRDGRYSVPRTSSLPVDEQQRMQQYNHLPGRSMPQSSLPVQGTLPGTDRGVRMLTGGNGMGMMAGMNRNMPRPGYQGMNSPSMMNSGSMLPTSMGIPSPANNMHSGPGSGQGNPMIRPREAMHMMRPGHNPEHQRQMTVPELQMQAAAQGNAPFNGLTSGFPNQTTPPTVPSYPVHPQQQQQPHGLGGSHHHTHLPGGPNHIPSSHQSLAIRRQMQQRYAQRHQQQQQQQQQFSGPNTLLPHAQNSSQIQSQPQSQPVTMPSSSPMTPVSAQHQHHHQQKHLLPPHAMGRSAGQMGGKQQRQRQPNQQHLQQAAAAAAGRQHPPQQRQMLPAQQQANNKLLKGVGRGGGAGLVQNGLSVPQGSQPPETMQGQGGGFSGSSHNPMQPPPKSMMVQQKLASGPAKPDSNPQGQAPPVTSPSPQQHQKQVNQTQQNVQRIIIQQNRQPNPEPPGKSQKEVVLPEQQHTLSNTNLVSSADSSSTAVPVCDSNMPKSAIQDSSGSNLTPPARQLSGTLVGAQWQQSQQQPPPLQQQQSQTLPPTLQQQQQQLEQRSAPSQIPVQQKPQQVGQGMYLRPANSKLE